MTQKEKLIDLLDEAIISARDNYGMPFSEDVADFLLGHGVCVLDDNAIDRNNLPLASTIADRPINDVLDLLKAEKQGRLIKLPCAVGDTVYWGSFDVYEGKITEMCVILQTDGKIFRPDAVGETVFLSREEAEAALKKR